MTIEHVRIERDQMGSEADRKILSEACPPIASMEFRRCIRGQGLLPLGDLVGRLFVGLAQHKVQRPLPQMANKQGGRRISATAL
jgi:hypothetical protein